MGFVGRKPTNAPLTSDDIPNGIIGAADLAAGLAKITFDTTPKTTGFTAVANTGYFCNTTSAAFTVTLPATPSAGDQVQLVDYAGTFDTNKLIIDGNGEDIEGSTDNVLLSGEREGVILTYIDSTQGWIATSGINEGTDALEPTSYSVDFLVIAGGASGGRSYGGGGGAGGYRNSYLTETSGGGGSSEASLTFNIGTVYTVTVGAGGAAVTSGTTNGNNGSNSLISGSDIATITSTGGGGGGARPNAGISGGSGGGSGDAYPSGGLSGGSGTANQGFAGGNSLTHVAYLGAGGGGAGAVGVNSTSGSTGGAGLASSITGSSVTRAGGGGGGNSDTQTGGSGGSGGGGAGAGSTQAGQAGNINTGSGGGGGGDGSYTNSGAGGKGVVILRMPTAKYSGTTTGSPTVGTDGTDTILTFNDSGSYTG